MAAPLVDCGTGTTLAFGSLFSATAAAGVYELTGLNWNGISRGEVETTHMATAVSPGTFGGRTWKPTTIVNSGTLEVEGHFNADLTPPIEDAAAVATVTFPGGTNWVGSGIVTDFSTSDPLEEKMTFACTMQMTSGVTINVV